MFLGVCSTMNCQEYEICKNIDGEAVCECPTLDSCPRDVKTVCGSDGKSYLNKCRMKLEACKKRRPIVARHDGICSKFLVQNFNRHRKKSFGNIDFFSHLFTARILTYNSYSFNRRLFSVELQKQRHMQV